MTLPQHTLQLMSLAMADAYGRWMNILSDESGQDLIEYALVAALVGLAAISAVRGLGQNLASLFTSIGTSVTSNT